MTGEDAGLATQAELGVSVALDADTLFVGAKNGLSGGGEVLQYRRNRGGRDAWSYRQSVITGLQSSPFFGQPGSPLVVLDRDVLAVGSPYELNAITGTRGAIHLRARNVGGSEAWGAVGYIGVSDLSVESQVPGFGEVLALQGDTLVVGVPNDDTAGSANGAVHIFSRHLGGSDQWGRIKRIDLPDSPALASGITVRRFGKSVDLDGDWLAVGSSTSVLDTPQVFGAVYLFQRNRGGADQWGFVRRIDYDRSPVKDADNYTSDGGFASCLALCGDVMAVAASEEGDEDGARYGAVYVYHRNQDGPDRWGLVQRLASSVTHGLYFGFRLALEADRLAVFSPVRTRPTIDERRHAVQVFRRNSGGTDQWGEESVFPIIPYARMGEGLALSHGRVAVGSPGYIGIHTNEGQVALFELDQGLWVTTTNDIVNAGDGLTSLREAVNTANAASPVIEETGIYMPAGTYTLALAGADEDANASGDLDFKNTAVSVTLRGTGARETIIDGGGLDRVIQVFPGANLKIQGVTLTGGRAPNGAANVNGGSGGGILNTGTLSVSSCTIRDNRAGHGGDDVPGGALSRGGYGGSGGGIFSAGTLTINRSTLVNNRAGRAGAGTPAGFPGDGGGARSSGALVVANSTFFGNQAGQETPLVGQTGNGGGLFLIDFGPAEVRQSTFFENHAGSSSGLANGYGGGICVTNTTLALSNSILAGNRGRTGAVNGFGPLTTAAHNLFATTAGLTVTGTPLGNLNNVAAQLGTLQDNGGLTDTCLPFATSPAINAGNGAVGGAELIDQRGVSRLTPNAPMDIGAVETTSDFDGDGLPDGYEIANGLDYQEPADGIIDSDGDSLNNRDERTVGTDLNDGTSVFRVSATGMPGGVKVTFPSLVGRLYTLLKSNVSPDGPYSIVSGAVNLPGTSGIMELSVTSSASNAFFLVRVAIAP